MISLIKKNRWWLTGVLVGALTGWAYWYFVGCNTDSCVISSRPANSIIYFSILGILSVNLFKKENQKQQ